MTIRTEFIVALLMGCTATSSPPDPGNATTPTDADHQGDDTEAETLPDAPADDDGAADDGAADDGAADDGAADDGAADDGAADDGAADDGAADDGAADDGAADSGVDSGADSGADSGTGEEESELFDPEVYDACPWIADHDYTHESDPFFEPTEVIRIDLEMDEDDWQDQLDDPSAENYVETTVKFCGEEVERAGMRFKLSGKPGADPLPVGDPKNPIVLDINEFVDGQDLFELQTIGLEYGDDRMLVAERLNWEMFAEMGLVASRVNYADVYVNDEYIGVFTNVERVDDRYVEYHFGMDDEDGQLYKHEYCGSFEWLGTDPEDYLAGVDGAECYDPQPHDYTTDLSELVDAIEVIDDYDDADFEAAFPTIWELDDWLSTMAIYQAIAYGDSPNANANNFYTWFPDGGDATVIPWDLDGGWWWGYVPCESPYDTLTWDIFQKADCFDYLPLFDRVLDVPDWRDQFLDEMDYFANATVFYPDAYQDRVDQLVTLLEDPLSRDPNRHGDDGDFADDLDELIDGQAARHDSVISQLDDAR